MLPLDAAGTCFTLGTDVVTLPKDEKLTGPRERFLELSARAAAHIPWDLSVSLTPFVGEFNGDPAASWFALLFQQYAEPIFIEKDDGVHYRRDTTVYQPVRTSIEAVGYLMENSRRRPDENPGSSKKPGRPGATPETREKEAEIAKRWQRARKEGVTKVDFANDNGYKMSEFKELLDRVDKRERRKKRSDK
ncbi:hypothetical protein OAS39_00045 [Pirellulales bacterium]|nr:hypothetical protein [Pirellulales bacterium]